MKILLISKDDAVQWETVYYILDEAGDPEIADLLRKHGAKTGVELKTEGK